MTDTDENLLTVAKLREQVRGKIEGDERFKPHTGFVQDETALRNLSFVEDVIAESDQLEESTFANTDVGEIVLSNHLTDAGTKPIQNNDYGLASYLVGITEQDLDASNVTLPARILSRLEYNGNLTTMLAAGAPNSGKTNTVWLCAEIAASWWNDLLVVSNAHAAIVDERVTTAHDLACFLLENRDVPKMVVIDEGSTHFDARTNSYEVANQWSPLLKRMAKLGVEVVAVIGHTGKDVDPDEPAPWTWNLEADLFQQDLEWDGLLESSHSTGPRN